MKCYHMQAIFERELNELRELRSKHLPLIGGDLLDELKTMESRVEDDVSARQGFHGYSSFAPDHFLVLVYFRVATLLFGLEFRCRPCGRGHVLSSCQCPAVTIPIILDRTSTRPRTSWPPPRRVAPLVPTRRKVRDDSSSRFVGKGLKCRPNAFDSVLSCGREIRDRIVNILINSLGKLH
jgi:hypothetical protein